jgi:hypothetical protein
LHPGCLGTRTSSKLAGTAFSIGNEPQSFQPPPPFLSIIAIHIPRRLSQHMTHRTPVQANTEASFRREHAGAAWDAHLHDRDGRHCHRRKQGGSGWPARCSRDHLSEVPYRHLGGMQHASLAYIAHRHSRLAQRERPHVHAPCIARGGQHDGAVRRRTRTRVRTCLCMPV